MNSFLQEMLYNYLPLKQQISILVWLLRDDYNGADESHSNTNSSSHKPLSHSSRKNDAGQIGGCHFIV